MTDQEMLQLAAKAAGVEDTVVIGYWNPLTDDGDALRLAVKLKMCVDIGGGGLVFALCGEPECAEATEEIHPDPLAATRLAITRAAAEIAKGMK